MPLRCRRSMYFRVHTFLNPARLGSRSLQARCCSLPSCPMLLLRPPLGSQIGLWDIVLGGEGCRRLGGGGFSDEAQGLGGWSARPVQAPRTGGAESPGGVRTCPSHIPQTELLCSLQASEIGFCFGVGDVNSWIKVKDLWRTEKNALGFRLLLKTTKEEMIHLQKH